MEDKYFEDLFNEGNIPFPELLSRIDSYPPTPNLTHQMLMESSPFSFGVAGLNSTLCPLMPEGNQDLGKSFSISADDSKVGDEELKAENKTESKKDKMKAIRAEKNRMYAKQSRDRKRKYIEELEAKLRQTQEELAKCKARLEQYELIEKYKNSLGYEFCDALATVYKEMQENNQPDRKSVV